MTTKMMMLMVVVVCLLAGETSGIGMCVCTLRKRKEEKKL